MTDMDVTTTTYTESESLVTSDSIEHISYVQIAGILIAIFIVAIVGNSIVIYVLFRKRQTWNVTTTYLFNLAVADAIFVCTLPLWAQAYLNRLEWTFGLATCKIVAVASSVNMYASIFFLTAMSVDRWIAVVHATTINTVRNSVMARTTCILVWMTAILLAIPRMIYQIEKEYQRIGDQSNTTGTTALPTANMSKAETTIVCTFFLPVTSHKEALMGALDSIQALIGFTIPMTVICVCYLRIVRTVRLKLISKRVRKERVAVLAALVVTAFFVCWLPFHLMTLYSGFAGWWNLFPFNKKFYQAVHPFCICLAYANSCINPFVYAFTATNFKNNVREVCGSNTAGCKDTRGYKMTLARDRSPYTPEKGDTNSKKFFSSTTKKNGDVGERKDKEDMSSSDDIYEPFDPQNRKAEMAEVQNPNVRPELQHLAIDDTTSGVYYEYFSSPAVLQTGPDVKVRNMTTRADIINHNDQDKTHHQWLPPSKMEPAIVEVDE